MKKVTIDFKGWEVFEDSQVEQIKDVCANSVEYMVGHLFTGAMATLDLVGDELFLNIHDADMDNDLGSVNIDDIFDSYTDANKLATPESKKRAVTLRDKLKEMAEEIDRAVRKSKSGD